MKRSRVFAQVKVFVISAALFVTTNAYAAAFWVRDVDGGDSVVIRITKWLCKICGDVLSEPGG